MSSDSVVGAAKFIPMICKNKAQKQRKRREIWVKAWFLRRPKLRVHKSLMTELQLEEENYYKVLG